MRMRLLTAAALTVMASNVAKAALQLDFGAPGQVVEPGFSAFSVTNSTNYNGVFQDFAGTGLDNGTNLRVTLLSSGTQASDYRAVTRNTTSWTGGLNNLLVEWIGLDNRPPDGVPDTTVRISNLAAGVYTLRSYHTDIGTTGNQTPVLDVQVNGSMVIDDFRVRAQTPDSSQTAFATTLPNFFDLIFEADGVNPVDITYLTQTNAGFAGFPVINGITLNQSPIGPTAGSFKIDINSTTGGGAPIENTPGWVSLDATAGNGATVAVGSTAFTVFSADGSRVRRDGTGLVVPNTLTGDFAFDDGDGQAVGLTISGLPAGLWQAEVWAWDNLVPTTVGDQIVGWIKGPLGSPETIVATNALPDPNNPISTFLFPSDGSSLYHIFTRENSDNNRSRLNALRLTIVPEPATALLVITPLAAALRRRKTVA